MKYNSCMPLSQNQQVRQRLCALTAPTQILHHSQFFHSAALMSLWLVYCAPLPRGTSPIFFFITHTRTLTHSDFQYHRHYLVCFFVKVRKPIIFDNMVGSTSVLVQFCRFCMGEGRSVCVHACACVCGRGWDHWG